MIPGIYVVAVSDYLLNVGKAASEQVAKTAKQLRETVEEKVIELCIKFCFKISTCLLMHIF